MTITLVTPYYRQPYMLARQLEEWGAYAPAVRERFRLIVIDDGSPSPDEALPLVVDARLGVELYRVLTDIPWNQHGARNLGAHVAKDGWLLMIDLDHVLLAASAAALVEELPSLDPRRWYRLHRRRTAIGDGGFTTFPIKPHINSFVVQRRVYWDAGGYDEDYCGCLCGDAQFHRALNRVSTMDLLDVTLDCYDRAIIPDATTPHLSRGQDQKDECKRRVVDKLRRGAIVPERPLRFPWTRQH